jgi:Tfp pilus assembly protein PilF
VSEQERNMERDPMRGWKVAGVIALAVIVLSIPYYVVREMNRAAAVPAHRVADAQFVGRDQCTDCHEAAYDAWLDSDHDKAMAHADEESVLGDFNDAEFEHHGIATRFYRRDGKYYVHTEGPGGEMAEFEIAYTFGVEPLQQYLVPFPGGRLQTLTIAWDTERGEWFALYPERIEPGDWLHWTRNAQNWNGMCAECHSTHLSKNYDADNRTFATTWSEVDVSCEACHGPGSRHVEWAEIEPMGRPEVENHGLVVQSSGIDHRQQVEMCAPCHSRRGETGDYDHRQADLLEQLQPSLLQEALYHADGQILDEVYVWGSFVQSKMYANGVRCSDCHDVHSLKLHQEGNELCLQCHRADTYDAYEHHFHQKIHEGEPSDGALCVKCHMPEQTYMVVDERADHSLRVPRPDLTLEIGVPNACSQSGCHDSEAEDVQWAADAYTEWYGKARKPHYGTIIAAARSGEPGALAGLVTLVESPLYPAIVRATALSLLPGYPGAEATRLIRRALEDEEALMRHTAVTSFTPASEDELPEMLAPLLFDPVRVVRMQAASRLAGIDRNRFKPYQLEAYDEALEEYIASSRANLDFAASGMNLGNLYAALGDAASSEQYYRTALEVDDLFYPAKMNLAVLLSQRGENVETERLLREVLEAYPEQHEAAYSLALLLVGLNRADEALAYLGQAAEGLAGRSRVHYNHGLLLARMGDDAGAEAALERALDFEPENIDYMYALVDFLYRRGRLIEAMNLVERMIATHPENRLGYDLKQAIGGQ